MAGTYTLRGAQPKLARVLLGLRSFPGETGAEFKEGDFQAGLGRDMETAKGH